MSTTTITTNGPDSLRERARRLRLSGLLAHWSEVAREPWVERLIAYEEAERHQRGLERRLKNARLGSFKPVADYDWTWPKRVDREAVEELFTLEFLGSGANVVFVGPNATGKTMLSKNLGHQAVLGGEAVLFTTASDMLNELAAQNTGVSLARRLRRYTQPRLLIIDEVGYLSYDTRHADLLFEVVTRRYEHRSIVLTTNKPFSEWNEVFPNASCVVTLVDRLLHRAEIINIAGDSYRLKEAKELAAQKEKARATKRSRRRDNGEFSFPKETAQ